MGDCIMDLHVLESGTQCFPRYLYGADGQRRDGITDATLAAFQRHYNNQSINKDHIFHSIYGILHSPHYRQTWAHNLTKELPRIPYAATFDDFLAFADAGQRLDDLHCGFESVPPCEGVNIDIHKPGCATLDDLLPEDFRVEKMKHGKSGGNKDVTTIVYNRHITVRNIPEAAYDYILNGKSAIAWIMERQSVTTDTPSGIVKDANRYAVETLNNPRYPLELLLRVIMVSLQTLQIVHGLPKLPTS